LIKLLISTDGTETNSFEVPWVADPNSGYGLTIYYVDNNNIKIQTYSNGLLYVTDIGGGTAINNQNWYYNIVICKFSP